MLFLIIYFLVFSLVLTGAFTWALERRWKKYLLGETYSGHTFIWTSLIFIFSYLGNIVASFVFPRAFVYLQLLMLAAACIFIMIKERGYKAEAGLLKQGLADEIAGLREVLKRDPSNTACHERLSELFESTGDMEAAAAHAEKAAGLDPTEKNKWRLETLRREAEEKRSVQNMSAGSK